MLVGVCVEELRSPFGAFTDALGDPISTWNGPLIDLVGADGGVLSALLPSLVDRLPSVSEDLDPRARARLVAGALRRTLVVLARQQPVVLVLEDVHWADHTGIALVRDLVTDPPQVPLFVLATSRDVGIGASDPLFGLLADVARCPGAHRLDLVGLAVDDAVELFQSLGGAEGRSEAVAELCRATSGNPLYLSSLMAEYVAGAPMSRLPDSVHDAITLRTAAFDPGTTSILEVAAVIGLQVDLDLLVRSVSGLDTMTPDRISEAIDRCIEAGILAESLGIDADYRFVHDVVRQAVLERTGVRRSARLHGDVGNALLVDCGDDPGRWSPVIDHLVASPFIDDHLAAARLAVDLLDSDIAALDLDESVRRAESVLAVLPRGESGDPLRLALLVRLTDLHNLRLDHQGHRQALLEAASIAERNGRPADLAEVITHYRLLPVTGTVDTEVLARVDGAIAALPRRGSEALRLRALLSGYATYHRAIGGEGFRVVESGWWALDDARASGDRATLATVLYNLSGAFLGSPDPKRILALLGEYDELRMVVPRHVDRHDGVRLAACAAIQSGDRAGFERFRARVGVGASATQSAFLRTIVVMWDVVEHLFAGRLDEAERANDALFALSTDDPNLMLGWLVQLVAIRSAQDRHAEVAPLLTATRQDHPTLAALTALSTWAECEAGHVDAAWSLAEPLATKVFVEVRDDWTLAATITWLTPVVARRGHARHAEFLLERLEPYAGQLVLVGSASLVNGAADRSIGMLLAALGRPADALRHLEAAESLECAAGALLAAATTRLVTSEVLGRSEDPSNRKRGADLLEDLRSEVREQGWTTLERQAELLG